MCKNVDGLNGKAGKVVDIAVTVARIVTPMLLSLMAWAWWNHEERLDQVTLAINSIENSRFTAADGLEVYKTMSEIQQQIHLKADIGGADPVWREITTMKDEINRLRDSQGD